MRIPLPVLAALLLGLIAVFLTVRSQKAFVKPPPPPMALSPLAEAPDWASLAPYQYTISRPEFEFLLTKIFTTDDTWQKFITLHETYATALTSNDPAVAPFRLNFSTPEKSTPPPRHWKSTASLPLPPSDKPLQNLHIAIDPGHIGGRWAKLEERWFQIGNDSPVMEGDMTLFVAKLLKPLLENLGAEVSLVRLDNEPITGFRPEGLTSYAAESGASDPDSIRRFTEKLFYRTAEIRARAGLVNELIKPDLVLCLHFNAEGWGDPTQPTLVPRTHFHILLNGAYTGDEVRLADQRFVIFKKILQRTHDEEVLVGEAVAKTFAEITKLPPFLYPPQGGNVRPVAGNPYLYARNLLANRLYDCPVIFMEPYVMNSTIDYPRIQAGDYEGLREINGIMVPSIFRDYASALAKALAIHYGKMR